MSVHLRPVLSSLPAYVPGRTVPGAIKLASNETPYPPLPHVIERIAAAAGDGQPLPRQRLDRAHRRARREVRRRRRAGARSAAARCRCARSSSRRSPTPTTRSSTRGARSRPTRSSPRSAARRRSRCRCATTSHDLDAMAERDHRQDPARVRLQPEQPDRHGGRPRRARPRSCARVPDDVVVALDEAYREFVTRPGRAGRADPARRASRTWSCCGPSPRPTGWPGCGSATRSRPTRRWRRRCARPRCPFAVTTVAQEAALASPRTGRRGAAARRGWPRWSPSATGCARRCSSPATTCRRPQANFVWLPLGDATTTWAAGCEERRRHRARVRRPRRARHDRHARGERPLPRRRRVPRNSSGRGHWRVRPGAVRRPDGAAARAGARPARARAAAARTAGSRRRAVATAFAPVTKASQPSRRPPRNPPSSCFLTGVHDLLLDDLGRAGQRQRDRRGRGLRGERALLRLQRFEIALALRRARSRC